MYISFRDIASFGAISLFLASMFTWADILNTLA